MKTILLLVFLLSSWILSAQSEAEKMNHIDDQINHFTRSFATSAGTNLLIYYSLDKFTRLKPWQKKVISTAASFCINSQIKIARHCRNEEIIGSAIGSVSITILIGKPDKKRYKKSMLWL